MRCKKPSCPDEQKKHDPRFHNLFLPLVSLMAYASDIANALECLNVVIVTVVND